jgi:hypothetical protein
LNRGHRYFQLLLKHTTETRLCPVPLQFCGTLSKTHRVAQNGKFGIWLGMTISLSGFEQFFSLIKISATIEVVRNQTFPLIQLFWQ